MSPKPPPTLDRFPDHASGSLAVSLADEQAAYGSMLLIRRFEERAGLLFAMGDIAGYCPLAIGEEAIAAGLAMSAADGDRMVVAERANAHMLAAGMEPKRIMAELLGRSTGYSGGMGGALHMASRASAVYAGMAAAGANASLATGIAFAELYRGKSTVTWCVLRAETASAGLFLEALATAARWQLAIVFVVVNAQTDELSASASTVSGDISQRGRAFAVPGWQVDGVDVRAVRDAGLRAAAWCRAGNGPMILEMLIEPYRGHARSDPAETRASAAAAVRRAATDAIARVRERLSSAGVAEDILRAIESDVAATVEEAVRSALGDPEPAALGPDTFVATGG